MEAINQIINHIAKLFDWWFIVMPWEQAVFIRAGKNFKVCNKGLYFKIPFIDRVYIQSMRLRMTDLPVQTISTKDNKTITIKSVLGYSIKDIFKLYNTISHPEMTMAGIIMSGIADHIKNTNAQDISIITIETYLLSKLKETDFGLGDLSIKITSWAEVKTYRLIQDGSWLGENLSMKYIGEK